MAWEYCADYEPDTLGYRMYVLEREASAVGAGELAKVDQLTARIRHYAEAGIFSTEPPGASPEEKP